MQRRQMQYTLKRLQLQRAIVPLVLLDAAGQCCGLAAATTGMTVRLVAVSAALPSVSVPLLRGAVEPFLKALPPREPLTITGQRRTTNRWTVTLRAGMEEVTWTAPATPWLEPQGDLAPAALTGSFDPVILADALARVVPIPTNDQDAPPPCRSIRVASQRAGTTLLATDGRRLVTCPLPVLTAPHAPASAVIPLLAARQLLAVLKPPAASLCPQWPQSTDPIYWRLVADTAASTSYLLFRWGAVVGRISLLDCPFPNYEQFIPAAAAQVTVTRAALLQVLADIHDSLRHQLRQPAATVLYAEARDSTLTLWAGTRQEPIPAATRTLTVEAATPVVGGGFVLADLRAVVQAVAAPEIVLAAKGECSQWLVRSSDPADAFLGLIMPAAA